jgi:hypothetical protein
LAAATHVIAVVADFGEELCAHLFGGEVVSHEEAYASFADVFVKRENLAIQVKMCNGRHAHRPTVSQITALHKEVGTSGFVADVDRGIYALVFYGGVHGGGNRAANRGKSKLLSRKLDTTAKRSVIANELQYIYVIEAGLMHHFATDPKYAHLRRCGKVKVCAERKLSIGTKAQVLYLNRLFLRGFLKDRLPDNLKGSMSKVFGRNRWNVQEKRVPIEFEDGSRGRFARAVPVRIIGSRSLASHLSRTLGMNRRPMPLDNGTPHFSWGK